MTINFKKKHQRNINYNKYTFFFFFSQHIFTVENKNFDVLPHHHSTNQQEKK